MLTEFGKYLRKLRIECQELLGDMAQKLGVSSAYLSAVETGKRRIPSGWVCAIVEHYKLPNNEAEALSEAYDLSQQEVTIQLQDVSLCQRSAAVSFAKALQGLTDEELKEIMNITSNSGRRRHKNGK